MAFVDEDSKKISERIIVALSLGIVIAYTVLIVVPSGWHTKVTQIWSFYVGLFGVSIKLDTIGGFLIKSILGLIGKAIKDPQARDTYWSSLMTVLEPDDQNSIQNLRDQFCNIELLAGGFMNNCQMWTYLMYSSWCMAFCLAGTCVCLVAGSGLLLTKPNKCTRYTSLALFGVAALVNAGGTAVYILGTWSFSRWLVEIYGSHDQLTFSLASVAAGGLTVVVLIIPGMVVACTRLPRKSDEDDYWENEPLLDEYGNPIPVDEYGNPMYGPPPPGYGGPPPPGYDQGYGGPPPPGYDQSYGGPPPPGYDPAYGGSPPGGPPPPGYAPQGPPPQQYGY